MKPQENEPCNNCRYWHDDTGCEMGRYMSAAMVIYGFCGFAKPKKENQDE